MTRQRYRRLQLGEERRIAHNARCLPDLLGLLHVHHAYLDQIRSCIHYVRPPDGSPPRPEPDDELWVLCERYFRRAYRLEDVADALLQLAERHYHGQAMARAIYWTYVEPWDAFCAPAWLARKGLEIMAREIRGDLPVYQPTPRPLPYRARRAEVLALREQGMSYAAIARAVGCSKTTVRAYLRAAEVRRGRVVAAGRG